ncbi:MAG: histidyl-tRNA synthetase [Acidobacteriota bacterium]|jgi:histidyl-tRNA synthetase|nr:histidyl-tRNA synthetase [Acidobacteriota bacterium]
MSRAQTQPARGMRDFLPSDVRRREYVIGIIKEVYERYGFEPLETPAVENIETLMGKYGEEGNQLIFKILKRGEHEKTGEADLALRYDLTVPLARVVAEYKEKLPKFFKRYQIQPVWRADRPARGRFREFYQCDVDALGSRSMIIEAELCAAASDVLSKLGFSNFTIRLNHRQVLTGVLDAAGIPADKHADALVALDKLDKVGREGVAREFVERGLSPEGGARLLTFFEILTELDRRAGIIADEIFDIEGGTQAEALNRAVLGQLIEFIGDHEAGARGVDELRSIIEFAIANGVSNRIKIDPSLARGLSYYTGAIMEINVPDLAGSLGGGGRYDNLVGMFSGQDVPACGFSLGLERIIVVMTELNMFPPALVTAPADVMVAILDDASISYSLALANELRTAKLRVDVYPEVMKKKSGKAFFYANARKIPFVTVLGEFERESQTVGVRDMNMGEQKHFPRDQVVNIIVTRLKERAQEEARAEEEKRERMLAAIEHVIENRGEK